MRSIGGIPASISEFFRLQIEQREYRRFYSRYLKSGDLCFDVGANVGVRTSAFLGLGARVVVVEPVPRCMDVLKEKFAGKNIAFVQKAAGLRAGTSEMSVCVSVPLLSSLSPEFVDMQKRTFDAVWETAVVETVTLDQLIREHGAPRLCKIDVENYEEEVLKGLSRPIPFISFEYHPEFSDKAAGCVNLLSNLGEYRFNFSEGDGVRLRLPSWVSAADIKREIRQGAVSESSLAWGDVYAVLP